ncbi:MAG: HAMP domain-containing protein [Acaryochloridaceae cyanobacterium RU_4_10]|nr:HAMP domain-containing protein [Acaryochloridaceae cyanobacterium RU_4_10]
MLGLWTASLRGRLTAWYTLLLGVSLLLFSGYLHLRLEDALTGKVASSILETVSDELLKEMLMSVPVVLIAAALGGLFLANRALKPIAHITRTAQEIGAGELSRRIGDRGTTDEVGRLARMFDQMLDRLQDAFEREKRFTADASHELRTPLTAIKGRIGMILSQPRTQAQYESTLSQLDVQVDRMIRLTNDLLFLSRLEQQRLPWNPVILDLSNLLEATAEQMRPLAEERQIRLLENIKPGLSVQGDPDHLIRLFLNLLDNAIKYTPVDGQVNIKAVQQDGAVWVTVSDTGTGIAPEHLPHLFERFYRVEAARSRKAGGTGLGLAIAHEIVRLHGGTLIVQSTIHQGTSFSLCFAVASPNTP